MTDASEGLNVGASANPQPSPTQEPSSKRRRVALACQHCRERKVKCDGARPVCGACQRRGTADQPCEYLVIADTAKYQTERAYIHSLRTNIEDLGGPSHQSPKSPPKTGVTPGRGVELQHTASVSNTLPIPLSGMGATLPDAPVEAAHDQFYGQSSLVSLVNQCTQNSPGHQLAPPQNRPFLASSSSPHSERPSETNMAALLSDDFSLPPRRQADWLLEIYFANNHIFYPWVHKETFMASYEKIWKQKSNDADTALPDVGLGGPNCSSRLFHCALNAMFAIACEFSNMDPCAKRNSSAMFHERMKSSMNIDILDSGSLAHVQALLLIALYLQCTPYPRRCWNVVGMAHRMAVGLGLQNRRQFRNLTGLEREMRWRAWCACVQMDVIVSMTMGRPPMTPSYSHTPLPSPVDDRYLDTVDQGAHQPEGVVSTNEFLHQNMKLVGILWKILLKVYRSEDESPAEESSSGSDGFKAIMELDKSLEEFKASLPPAFVWGSPNPRNSDYSFRRQSNVLHARYLHLKLLLYRPTFSAYCSAANSRSYEMQEDSWLIVYQQNAALKCVQAACDLIQSLSNATTEDATGAWWYGVFYLISAGIVLLLAESSGADFKGMSTDQQQGSWNACLETLNRMVSVHPSARDYYIALRNIRLSYHSEGSAQTSMRQDPPITPDHSEVDRYQASAMHADNLEPNMLSPLIRSWDTEIGDIMFPAQFLQELDEGLLLPNLF